MHAVPSCPHFYLESITIVFICEDKDKRPIRFGKIKDLQRLKGGTKRPGVIGKIPVVVFWEKV